jgi:hypothetical protein
MKDQKSLSRDEMKKVVGGTGKLFYYNCSYTAGGPEFSNCVDHNPTTDCGYYQCTDTGAVCTLPVECP